MESEHKATYETEVHRFISYYDSVNGIRKGQIEVILKRSGKLLSHIATNKAFSKDELKKFASYYESKNSK